MPMTLGDFFASAAHARPINPRQITFTAVARGTILPNGQKNPHERPVGASVTAALVFVGGDGGAAARTDARKHLREAFTDKGGNQNFNDDDWWIELNYQIIFRSMHQWDPKECKLGDRLFSSVEEARSLIEIGESNRIVAAYNKYAKDEHPEAVDQATFRGVEG